MPKSIRNNTIIMALSGAVLSVAAFIIFTVLPSSELANGIQYSGTDALWVLALTPAFSLVGAANFLYAFLKNHKLWSRILSKTIVLSASLILGAMMIFNFAVYAAYFFDQFKLGFVAPFGGTVYESLQIIVGVFTVLQLLFGALSIPATSKNK